MRAVNSAAQARRAATAALDKKEGAVWRNHRASRMSRRRPDGRAKGKGAAPQEGLDVVARRGHRSRRRTEQRGGPSVSCGRRACPCASAPGMSPACSTHETAETEINEAAVLLAWPPLMGVEARAKRASTGSIWDVVSPSERAKQVRRGDEQRGLDVATAGEVRTDSADPRSPGLPAHTRHQVRVSRPTGRCNRSPMPGRSRPRRAISPGHPR